MFGDRIKPTKSKESVMPLNTDPDAIPDDDYYAEYKAHAERVGDAGLHTDAAKWLEEQEGTDGEDR